jgi:hypothetical protein
METSPVRSIINKFEESLSVDVSVPNAKKFEKLPIKLLINKYENMKVRNESIKDSVHCVQSIWTECGPSRAYVSCDKPEDSVANCQLENNVPVLISAKPTENGCVSSMISSKGKKKVWGVKKNGLYGWNMVVVDKKKVRKISKHRS